MFAQRSCGCPIETSRYPYRCRQHVNPQRMVLPTSRPDHAATWYRTNTCPYCDRGNPGGLACDRDETCPLCGVVSCDAHGMAVYKLKIICPRDVNPRTKVGRALLRSLAGLTGGQP